MAPEVDQQRESIGSTSSAIINGSSCASDSYASALAILFSATVTSPYGQQMPVLMVGCSGTLIAPDVVLTAGHCVHPDKGAEQQGLTVSDVKLYVSFEADLTHLEQSGSRYPPRQPAELPDDAVEVSEWIAHPDFDMDQLMPQGPFGGQPPYGLSNLNDVGLLFLSEAISQVQPAVVITTQEASQLAANNKVQIVGYGQTTPQQSNPFQPGQSSGYGTRSCAQSFINDLGTHEMQIGGDSSTPRKCHGDSGGPSYMTVTTSHDIDLRVVGITSRAYDPQMDCYLGGVDTRVDAHLAWIDQTMSQGCDEGSREWCDIKGIIPPSFYDAPEPPEQPQPTDPADEGNDTDTQPDSEADKGDVTDSADDIFCEQCEEEEMHEGGCSLARMPAAADPLLMGLGISVIGLLLARRRRSRHRTRFR